MLPIQSILEKINPLEKQNSLSAAEFYLGLAISDKKVKSGIWTIDETGAKTLSFGSTESWSNDNADELIVAADASIASAVANLPPAEGKQPSKVILGLPEYWVKENAINKTKSEILQRTCQKLLLKPLGFVVTPEAIAYFLKKEQGGFPGAILVSVGDSEITVSLIVKGKFLGSKIVGRSDNLALDLEEGLQRFDYREELPSRILLIDDKESEGLEDFRQNLVAYPWVGPPAGGEKKVNFLQLPKIEIMEKNLEVSAIVLAGSRELGQEPNLKSQEREMNIETVVTEEEEKPTELPVVDFGFVEEKDILSETPKLEQNSQEASQEKIEEETMVPEEDLPVQGEIEIPVKNVLPKNNLKKVFLNIFGLIKRLFSFRKMRMGGRNLPSLPSFSFKLLLPLVFLLIIILGGAFAFYKFSRAEIKIFVRPFVINKEVEFTVSSKIDQPDEAKMLIPARSVTAEVNGKKQTTVTGKKVVGDKATGEIVIYNGTDKSRILSKGTKLKGPGGLKFNLSAEANVPGKTTDLNAVPPIDKWGEKKVSVVAEDIGTQFNLAANSTFNFEQIASSAAWLVKNPSAFSGGTSREIQAVSKQDREDLQKSLIKDLKKKAEEQIKNKLNPGDYLLSEFVQLESKTDSFNHEIDDETDSLSLEEKASFTALFFKTADFKIIWEKTLGQLLPEGYLKSAIKEEMNFEVKDKNKGTYLAKIHQEFLPMTNSNEIISFVRGKRFSEAESFLKNIKDSAGFDVSISPKIFSKLKFFPFKEENITLKIESI